MPYRHFQIPCSGGETEAAMTLFLNQHRVLKVEKQFVEAGLDSFWAYQVPPPRHVTVCHELSLLHGPQVLVSRHGGIGDS